jgi:hypothetical protein
VPERESPHARELGYEPSDVSVRWVLIAAIGGLLLLALAAAALYGLQRLYALAEVAPGGPPPSMLERHEARPPPPRLEADPAAALTVHKQREAAILGSYGWVDERAGIARIPIEQAMRLLAERGWPQPAAGPPTPPTQSEGEP